VRAVINDIAPEVDPRGGQRIASYVGTSPQRFTDMDTLLTWYRANYPQLAGMGDAEFREYVTWQVKPDPQSGLTWKMDPVVRNNPRRGDPAQLWALAKAITAPVLLVRGGVSDLLSPELAKRMVAELKDCRMVEVPGVGHAPSLLESEALPAVKAFLGVR
jgi:pimeloyl-ACP methyl ester carboxylesterase